MKTLYRRYAFLTLVGFLLACSQSPDVDMEATIERDVRAALARLEEADRALDAETVIDLLAPEFYMIGDGTRVSRDQTVEQISSTLPTLRSFETRFENIEVHVISHDAALATMIFHDSITDADGNMVSKWGPTTYLWRLHDGEWKIAFLDADHYPE